MPSKKSKSKSASKRSSPTTNGGGGTRLSSLSGKKNDNNNLADEQAPPASEQAAAAAAAAANSEAGAVDLESAKDGSFRSSQNGSEPSTADLTTTTTGGNEPFAASASRGGKGSSSAIDINAAAALKSSAKSVSTEVTRQRDNLSGRLSARSSFQSSVGSSQGMGGTGHATSSSNNNTFNARAVSVSSSEADADRRAEMVLSANRLAAVAAEGRNTSSIRRQKKAASEAGSNPSSTGSGGRSGGAGSSSAASHRTGSSIRSRYSNRYVAAAQSQSGRRSSDNNNSDLRDMYVDGGTDGGKRDSLPKRLGAQSSLLDMDGSNGNQSGLGSRSSLDRSSTNFSGSVKGGGSEFGDRSAMSITESARQSMAGGGRRATMAISKLNISPDQLIGREEEQKLLLDAFARTRGKDGASQISSPAPTPSGGADGGANGGVHHCSILEQDNEDDDENEGEGDEDTSPRNKNYRNTSSNSAAQDNDANSDMDFADLANVDVTETFPEIAMVHGRSGAGKTVFIQNTLRAHRKFFLQGKFDLHARSARPYAAFCDAFADLAAQIMDLPDSWEVQKALVDAVGDDGAVVICDLIPSLEDILEPTRNNNRSSGSGGAGGLDDSDSITSTAIMMLDTDVEAGPDELNRLQYMLRKMIGAVGTPERPVVLFLDDLHWADEPSLALLENLATDNHNGSTLIVGTYRSNEVDDEHPLIAALNNIKQRRSDGITDISLGNLSKESCLELVAEALRSTTRATQELGEVVYEKTSGNAFFVTAFLQALDSEGLITFNLGTFQWHWSLSGISKKHVSENVSDLMKLRLLDLNEEDQKVLMVASCLGCEFDQKTLSSATSMATGIEDVDLPRSLWNAVEGGVLRSVDNESLYAFVHDQIQFAAFVAIPETERNTFQACVGAAIIENAGPEALTGDLLLIAVDLCNCDSSQMKDRALLAKLNLKAGRSAVRSAAFAISASYFEAGLNLLDEEMYMSKMSLVIDLHTLFAQSLYCQGNFDRCIEVLDDLLAQSVTIEEKLPAYFIKLTILFVTNRHGECMPLTKEVFKELGFSGFPKKTNIVHVIKDLIKTKMLVSKHKDRITELPLCTDTSRKIAMGLLDILVGVCYIQNDPALSLVVFRILRWSIKHGLCAHSGTGLVMYGVICIGLGDLKGGHEFGEIASAVHKRMRQYDTHTKRMYIVETLINHYQLPMSGRAKKLLDICEVSMRNGDNEGGMWALLHASLYSWFCGMNLRALEDKIMKPHQQTIFDYQIVITGTMILPFRQATLNLMGESDDPLVLTGEAMDEKELLDEAKAEGNLMCKNCVNSIRMELAYQFHEYVAAMEIADVLDPPEQAYPAFFQGIRQKLFEGLTCFALAREGGSNAKSLKRKGNFIIKQFSKLVKGGDVNVVHYVHLLGAEQKFAKGKSSDAREEFDRAISTASRNGFIQDRALSHERCALFFVKEKDNEWASHHMKKAIQSYEDWGASRKVQHLQEKFSDLLS